MIEKYTELLEELPPARDRDEADWALFNAYTEILEDLNSCLSCSPKTDATPVSQRFPRQTSTELNSGLSISDKTLGDWKRSVA